MRKTPNYLTDRTVGTAADWLLRFLFHPRPDIDLAVDGAAKCTQAGIDLSRAVAELAKSLDVPLPTQSTGHVPTFTGPMEGSRIDLLARACWVLALITEARRGGP
jgi:hypothetical protein